MIVKKIYPLPLISQKKKKNLKIKVHKYIMRFPFKVRVTIDPSSIRHTGHYTVQVLIAQVATIICHKNNTL